METEIYQIYQNEEQRRALDPGFLPYNNLSNPHPKRREFFHQLELHRQLKPNVLTGLFSNKFYEKSNLRAESVKSFVTKNPNFDLYLFNPFPSNAYWSFNCWDHASMRHPRIMNIVRRAFDKSIGQGVIDTLPRMSTNTLVYCSFWVGNKTFWDKYIAFLEPLYHYMLSENALDNSEYYCEEFNLTYFPYILERVVSTLISIDKSIRVCPYQYPSSKIKSQSDLDFVPELYDKVHTKVDAFDRLNTSAQDRKSFYEIVQPYIPKVYLRRGDIKL